MACHPHDPGVPPGEGFQRIDAVLGTVDGLKKFVSIRESPYHGLNFCQGTVSEMLQDPGKEIFDVIRYFGSRKKIFNVHFRNIRGKRNDFVGDVSRRRRRRFCEGNARLQRSRLPVHADAGSCAGASGRSGRISGFRLRLRIYSSADSGSRSRSLIAGISCRPGRFPHQELRVDHDIPARTDRPRVVV